MDFITHLREQEQTMPRMEAIVAAVDWCIAHEILADFFREHRTEVSNMILNELTNADAIEAVREETREATWEEARKEERQQVINLINQGLTVEQLKQALQREDPRVVL
jgi:secreted Zn-dependent insulinase-like peptidase